MLYFDHAATTPMNLDALDLLTKCLKDDFANPASNHKLGRNLKLRIDQFKQDFIATLGASKSDLFIFTSSATESNNTVINGLNLTSKDIALYSLADHKSIVAPIENLKKNGIVFNHFRHAKNGEILFENLNIPSTDYERVKLICLTHVNGQSGVIVNIAEESQKLKSKFPNAHIHIDAVQSFAKISFKINAAIDSVSITSHKIGGPKGVAGLFLKKGHKVQPLILGGEQQDNLRASTEAYPLMAAFHKATQISIAEQIVKYEEVIKNNSLLIEQLKKMVPQAIFPFTNSSPYVVCLIIPNIPSDVIIRHLEVCNVYISSTSACSSKIKGFNSTLKALEIDEKFHKNVLRISLSPHQSNSEIQDFLNRFHAVWSDLAHLVK